MKKILIILSFFIMILSSCSDDKNQEENNNEITCEHSYNYVLSEDCSKIIGECQNCDFSYEIAPNFNFSYNYGYFDLNRFGNAKNAQKLYLNIYLKIYDFSKSNTDLKATSLNGENIYQIASINYTNLALSKEEAMAIWHLVILDNPEFYFVEKSVKTSSTDILILCNDLYANYEQRKTIDDEITELKIIKFDGDVLKKISEIHDYVIDNMSYAYEYVNNEKVAKTNFDSYELSGALLYKEGVCEAYCKLFGYLLKCNGIKSIMYVGDGILLSGKSVRHSWTLVEIDNLYYGFDLTWNDSNSNRAFYGLSEDNLNQRHQVIPFSSSNIKIGIDYIYKMPSMALENLIENL